MPPPCLGERGAYLWMGDVEKEGRDLPWLIYKDRVASAGRLPE